MTGVVTEKENTEESESDPSACDFLLAVFTTFARFASDFDSFFFPLNFGQSTFQCPISLQRAH